MRCIYHWICVGLLAAALAAAQDNAAKAPTVYPAAILEFAERGTGMTGAGKNAADVLFASLAANQKIILVERDGLKQILDELTLSKSGVVAANDAVQIGRLTGAQILITGSVFRAGKKTYLVAKIIGTETGRVLGASVNGTDDVATLTEDLAKTVSTMIEKSSDKLMSKDSPADRLAALQKAMAGKTLPPAAVRITEKHIGRPAPDPATQTELMLFYRKAGGTLIDLEKGTASRAELKITGEAFSEFAADIGRLKSVKARVEVKVTNSKGEIVAVDRQTSVAVDLTELKAGKAALQEAAARIAERLIPKLATAKK